MAPQQTDGSILGHADDAFRSAQQKHQESGTQPAFIAAATPHNTASDTDLSAFLSGADVHNGLIPINTIYLWLLHSCLAHSRAPRCLEWSCVHVYDKHKDTYL